MFPPAACNHAKRAGILKPGFPIQTKPEPTVFLLSLPFMPLPSSLEPVSKIGKRVGHFHDLETIPRHGIGYMTSGRNTGNQF
jgi:hypothetical protein